MKNALNYYYGLNPTDIHQTEGLYKFEYQNNKYVLMPTDYEIKELNQIYNLTIEMNNSGFYTHQLVLNKQNNLLTYINDNNYILMRVYDRLEQPITINDIMFFSNQTKNISNLEWLRRDNWYDLWTKKIDYLEYQVSQLGKKYPLLRESFNYFVGLAETGITLLTTTNIKYSELSIAHKRIKKNNTLFDLYNPLNFIIDFKVRDSCEYFKERFKNNINIIGEINNYLQFANLNSDEIKMFFIRMIYPSFYFDLYEKIITGEEKEEKIIEIIDRVDEYEELLKNIYYTVLNYTEFPEVEWLKKT